MKQASAIGAKDLTIGFLLFCENWWSQKSLSPQEEGTDIQLGGGISSTPEKATSHDKEPGGDEWGFIFQKA